MLTYSEERKAAVLKKLLSPSRLSVRELAQQEGIGKTTVYSWLKQTQVRDKKFSNYLFLNKYNKNFGLIIAKNQIIETQKDNFCRIVQLWLPYIIIISIS